MENTGLKKQIGLFQATFLVVGIVIGSGVFFKPSAVFGNTGAPGLGIAAWVAGCLLTIAGALSISEIGAAIPKTGGLYIYLKELFGKKWAFLLGWVQVLIYYPGISAALAVVLATQSTTFIPMTDGQQKILAVSLILFLMVVNLISTRVTAKLATVFNVAKLIPIFVIVICGLAMGNAHSFTPFMAEKSSAGGFGAALLGVLFAYEGWVAVANMSGELKNPTKDLPKAIVLGLSIVTIAYIGVNLAILNTMSVEQIAASKKVATDASVFLFGKVGEVLIATGILISITGCLAGFLLASGRVPYAMAQDDLILAKDFFAKVDDRSGTPANAVIFESVLACLYALTGTFDTLTDLSVFVMWMFFILGIGGVFVLRRRRQDLVKPDGYKVPFYPITPLFGICGAIFVVLNTLATGATTALYGVAVTLLGFPVYMYIQRRSDGNTARTAK
ncbi:MAG TPA: amino acid permease [Selenomonadales bacterium]|nr:amino acid permease [Selenomonadales bacterium]